MSLEKQIQEGIKQAMIAKDKTRLESLRAIKSQILLAKTAEGAKLEEDGSLSDDQILKLIQKLVKQHQESADLYTQNNRPELAEAEIAEAKVMEAFLPKQMSPEELAAEIKNIIAEVGATSMKEMGKVMGVASRKLAGKAEGKAIADAVKAALSAL